MKKIIIIFLLAILNFSNAHSQTDEKPNWRTYSSSFDDVLVDLPKAPRVDIVKNYSDSVKTSKYRSLINDTYYFVFSEELGASDWSVRSVSKEFISQFTKAFEMIKIADYKGKSYKFKDNEGFYHKVIFLNSDKRAYTFHAVSQNENYAETDNFFNSITFQTKATKKLSKNQPTEESSKKPESVGKPAGGIARDEQSKIGESAQNTSDKPVTTIDKPTEKETRLKILSNPLPSFTEMARLYDVCGTILVSVTFLGDGTIGDVTPTKKLPFGLTQNAIKAAKAIKFQPAMLDGKPITVSKMVQYTLRIY